MDARATPDDLLELGHRAHFPVEHDQPAGLGIDAGGQPSVDTQNRPSMDT